jgi:3-phosphoshikimate 1-carboxyvinyltransferase
MAEGSAKVSGFLRSADCLATVDALRSMGVSIEFHGEGDMTIRGVGPDGFSEPDDVIDCGNSGTLMRLILGLLAGQPFTAVLTGDASLRSRPMSRVIEPLRTMGATIMARKGDTRPPVTVRGGALSGISFTPSVPSAQVKSCVLLAGLLADGVTEVNEARKTRDHTERMLEYLGANVVSSDDGVRVGGQSRLIARDIVVPGDISSAAFAVCAAAACPGAHLTVRGVGINPSRTGVLRVLERMGAQIEVKSRRCVNNEEVADLVVTGTRLSGVDVPPGEIPDIIDEIPIIALIATQCTGVTTIRGAAELRVKESDRVSSIEEMLKNFGADVSVTGDDITVGGPSRLRPCTVDSHGDHRIAMTAAVAAAFVDGVVEIRDTDCIDTSFPCFIRFLEAVSSSGRVESCVLS